jgi:hypothetical protein
VFMVNIVGNIVMFIPWGLDCRCCGR